jgi:GTP-binding protein EngB required for normal cell division
MTPVRPEDVQPRQTEDGGAGGQQIPLLQALSFLASEAGALTAAADAALLAARTDEGLFYVTCVGQFKRGKSTLINALVEETLLPAGVVPVTSVVTVVRHGPRRSARVRLPRGKWREIAPSEVGAYVSEELNPGNRKGVLAAEILLPSQLLASGLCLVDTPGLGSISEANTAATRAFIPHIDAAIVVLGADPPISGEELALVEDIARTVSHLAFVLNKADRTPDDDRAEANGFARRAIEGRLGRSIGRVLEISAAEVLRTGSPTRDLKALLDWLYRLAQDAGADLVASARDRGARRILDRVTASLQEQRDALLRPIETSRARIDALRASVDDATRALGDLTHLFAAEQERLSREFFRYRQEFLASQAVSAGRDLEAALALAAASGPALRRFASEEARRVARTAIEGWLVEVEPVAERLYRAAMRRFVDLANEFLARLPRDDEAFSSPEARRLDPETGFRTRRRFYFSDLFELAPHDVRLLDLARSGEKAAAAVRRDAGEYLRTLLDHNSTRVVNDFEERTLESRRRLEAEIQLRLRDRLDSAAAALERGRIHQAAGSAAVEKELRRIESLLSRAELLGRRLSERSPGEPGSQAK